MTLVRGSLALKGAILDCLARNGARYQLAPVWKAETLFDPIHTPNLNPEGFFLAMRGETVVGCLAVWDQSGFKQTIVRAYAAGLERWRKLINLVTHLGNWPILPSPNTPFRYCFASHLAIDDDDPQVFALLLRSVYNQAAKQGYDYFMLGLNEANPLLPVVTNSYRHITYTGQLYLVDWNAGDGVHLPVGARLAQPEIAIL